MKNKEKTLIHRREFLSHAVLAFLSGVAVTLTACGKREDEEEETTQRTTQSAQGLSASVANNHGHSAFISSAQLSANQSLILNIQGSAAHNHTVSLTSAEVNAIRQGSRVTKSSSLQTDGHAHTITFN